MMHRAGAALTIVASLFGGLLFTGACSSFGGEDVAATPEAGADALDDRGAPSACTLEYVDDPAAKPDDKCGPGGAAVSLSTDPLHCGACGHRCVGDVCQDGMCLRGEISLSAPVTLAQVHGAMAYVVRNSGQVFALDLPLSQESAPFTAPISGEAQRLDFDATHVYVSTAVEQIRFARDPGTKDDLELPPGAPATGRFALGDTSWFYAWPSGVARMKKGSAAPPLVLPRTGVIDVVAKGDEAFWLEETTGGTEIHSFTKAAAQLESRIATAKEAKAAAVDATHVYFMDIGARQLRRVKHDGGNSESVASEAAASVQTDVFVDGEFVYWTADRGSVDGWVLMRVSKCGGLPLMLAKDLAQLSKLSADERFIYVVNRSGATGNLFRFPK
ncbi:MAG: hypothetical protein KF819_23955 [Labilithrix sp.]|nr:hypothetical protein [Labilithrix sp.]